MGVTSWLVDTSALARLGASPSAATWAGRIDRGLVRVSTVTRLEIGYSARRDGGRGRERIAVASTSKPIPWGR